MIGGDLEGLDDILSRAVADKPSVASSSESGIINTDRMFHSYYDPMQEVMGSASESHPDEIEEIYKQLIDWGVAVNRSDYEIAYQPGFPGKPGRMKITPDASYSAWLHEAQHAIDDFNAGWDGYSVLYNDRNVDEIIRREQRAFQREIDLAQSMGMDEMVKRLEGLRDEQIRKIKR